MRTHALILAIAAVVVQAPAAAKSIKMDQEIADAIQRQYDAEKQSVVLDEFMKTLATTGNRKALSQVAHSACMSASTWQLGLRLTDALAAYPELKERLDVARAECNISAKGQLSAAVGPGVRGAPGRVFDKYDPISKQVLIPGFEGVTLTPDEWRAIESGTMPLSPAFDPQLIKLPKPRSDIVIDKKGLQPPRQ